MQSTILIVTLGLLAASVSASEERKICLKTTDSCKELGKSAKGTILELRAAKIVDPATDIPAYITKLQGLFNATANSDCHVDVCACLENKLVCDQLANKLRPALLRAQLPACGAESEVAKAFHAEFKKAVTEGNRAGIVDILGKLNNVVAAALQGEGEEKEKLVSCLKESVLAIRTSMKEKIAKFDPQPNCDFCEAQ